MNALTESSPLPTVRETVKKKGDSCLVAKKGSKYVAWRNGELALTANCGNAIAFPDEVTARGFIEPLLVDDRNAAFIGRSYGLAPISIK